MASFEFIIFSDLHAHPFRYGAKMESVPGWGGLYNSRLLDAYYVLQQIHTYASDHNIRNILFGGDLFHQRQMIHKTTYALVYFRLYWMSRFHEITMIPGNHDYADRKGNISLFSTLPNEVNCLNETALQPMEWILSSQKRGLEKLAAVSLEGEEIVHEKYARVVTVPYTEDLEQAKKFLKQAVRSKHFGLNKKIECNILLAHQGIQGGRVGSDYVLVSPGDVQLSDIPYKDFDACFFGHFHEHQQICENAWFIGATHEHNWGDSGGKRGFLHVTINNGNVDIKRIETSVPKFVTSDTLDDYNGKDFFRLVTKDPTVTCADERVEVIYQPEESESADLEVENLDPDGMIEPWVDANGSDLDKKALTELGKSLLSDAKGEVL